MGGVGGVAFGFPRLYNSVWVTLPLLVDRLADLFRYRVGHGGIADGLNLADVVIAN